MPFYELDGLKTFGFEIFAGMALSQAVFTRRGGVSPAPWNTLNLGGTVGDDPGNVHENRQRAFQALGLNLEAMYDVWQVHSNEVVVTRQARPATEAHRQADAILTDQPGLTLFMRFADCVPILLFDPRRKAVGMVHAGWKGTVNQIVRRAVEVMEAVYHTDPADVVAGIGPSICVDHYEVGREVADAARLAFGQDAAEVLLVSDNGEPGVKFDLWKANRLILERAGVRQVEIAGVCTAGSLSDWFSHRGEQGKTGRFGAVIRLND